ncbi:hypothetical protein [Tropicimonas sp. IMCC34011]|uniref:hypothetical protein n=1 Tax=Tropicimonas sp. IMCC34011 TaxID=2248759 RepID=UPI000E25EE5C|nr:hypothetical protein [Tropicimonas sp. IMCC34011]
MSRLKRTLGAQVYGQAVTVAVQVGLLPILIASWGVEVFGVWAVMTAIPAALSLADFGFTSAGKTDMALRVSAGDRDGAVETYHSVFVLLLAGAALLAIPLGAGALLLPLERILQLGPVAPDLVRAVLLVQIASALSYQFFLLMAAGLRAAGRPATEAAFGATARLGEAAAVALAAVLGGSLLWAAACALATRLAALVVLAVWLGAIAPWLRLGLSRASGARIRALAGPSVASMLIPLGHALLLQAPLLILGAAASPTAAALYSVSRTVARVGVSAANAICHAFTPEYSYAHGARNRARHSRLVRAQGRILGGGAVLYALAAPFGIPAGAALLSGGALSPGLALTAALAAAALLEILWSGLFAPVAAINRHRDIARAFCLAAILGAALASRLATPAGIAAAVALAHGLTCLAALRHAVGLIRTHPEEAHP